MGANVFQPIRLRVILQKRRQIREVMMKGVGVMGQQVFTLKVPNPCRLSQPKWAHSPHKPQFTQSPGALLE
jgi:hypothetical protein